jgi:hypothetical protein
MTRFSLTSRLQHQRCSARLQGSLANIPTRICLPRQSIPSLRMDSLSFARRRFGTVTDDTPGACVRRVGPGYRPMDVGITLRLQNVPNGWAGRPIISNAGRASEVAEGRRSWRPRQTRAALLGIERSPDYDTLRAGGVTPIREVEVRHDATGLSRCSEWRPSGQPCPSHSRTTALRNRRNAL